MIFSPYLQGVPNAKNSYLYSRLMFLQSNAEHIPCLKGKNKKKRDREKEKGGGGRHKGLSYFLCHLLASTFTAIPLHHVKDCKQANSNSALEATARERRTLSRGLAAASGGRKKSIFIVYLNNIYILDGEKRLHEDLYEPLSLPWISIYGTCHSQDAEVPSLLFMTRHPIMAYHSLNGTQLFTSEYRPVPFFSQIEAMSVLSVQGGCY